jgi:hypothetical protein
VIGLTAGDLSIEGETCFYSYRGKGGKRGRLELPQPAYEAILGSLADIDKTVDRAKLLALPAAIPVASAAGQEELCRIVVKKVRRERQNGGGNRVESAGKAVLRKTAWYPQADSNR